MRVFFGPASARSCKICVVGNNWLVGHAIFSETALRIFLTFCMKLGDYKGRKVTEPDFYKKNSWFEDIREKVSKLAQNQTLIFFSKTALTIFLVFWPKVGAKYDLQFEWNLLFRKFWNFEIFGLEIIKKLPKLRFLAIFSTLHH